MLARNRDLSIAIPTPYRSDTTQHVADAVTSVYPAKGRTGSGSTKLDSKAQKRLIRSRIDGYGPRPRPARDWPVPLSYNRPTCRRAGELAGHCAGQRASPVGTFSKWAISHLFSEFLHIKGRNFPYVFYPFTSTYDPYEP